MKKGMQATFGVNVDYHVVFCSTGVQVPGDKFPVSKSIAKKIAAQWTEDGYQAIAIKWEE